MEVVLKCWYRGSDFWTALRLPWLTFCGWCLPFNSFAQVFILSLSFSHRRSGSGTVPQSRLRFSIAAQNLYRTHALRTVAQIFVPRLNFSYHGSTSQTLGAVLKLPYHFSDSHTISQTCVPWLSLTNLGSNLRYRTLY